MKMAPRLHILVCAICVFGLFNVNADDPAPEFPFIKNIDEEVAFTTEVQVTDAARQDTAYAIEYFDSIANAGKMVIVAEGDIINVYYNNGRFEILEVNATTCTTWREDESVYAYTPAFYGWLNQNPLVIGPSAPLFYAQTRRKDIKYEGIIEVRNIQCEHYTLEIAEKRENVTLNYYFARKDWTTPYSYDGLRVPIRIRAVGNSSKGAENEDEIEPVDVYTDFAYFKPSIDFDLDLQPPVGLGCSLRNKSDTFPGIPMKYRYSAEVVDLLYESQHNDVDVKFERVWYDKKQKIARFDIYKKTTSSSSFQDYNTGVMFEYTKERNCKVVPLKNGFFEKYDVDMLGEMKDEKEVLNLQGDFYDMGQRNIRGLICDVYESVTRDVDVDGKLDRLVVTAYFVEDYTKIGVNGEEESRIPIAIVLTGWRTYSEMAFKRQYNVFAFDDEIFPAMYSDFGIEECYGKAESKAYIVLIMQVSAADAAKMEGQDEIILLQLRSLIAEHAAIPDWRIPFLKIDYKTTGVFATGMMLERPPELSQFYQFDQGQERTYENDVAAVTAATLEDCAASCIDYEEPCKGFYFCNAACFVKMTDPSDTSQGDKELLLGQCDEYIRAVRGTTNFGNTPLIKALENLERAVFNQTIEVAFQIKDGEEDVKVIDIVIGDGPYTGVDAGDKPYVVNVQFRKLDASLPSTKVMKGVEMLNDCYKKCQSAGSTCSSFSFCGRSKAKERECIISTDMVVRGRTNDLQLIPSSDCDIYDLKYLEYFTKYPEQVSFLSGYKDIREIGTVEECAKQCRLEEKGKCRGFEYCKALKTCSLHTKHILDLKPGEKGTVTDKNPCTHYAARFIADYIDMGHTIVDDNSNVREDISLEECARVCSEELGESCKSFNFCPANRGSCALSRKVLADDKVATTETDKCIHYEKREGIKDWSNTKEKELSSAGFTSKGFTGLVIGMLVVGLIVGVLGFVGYSYCRSRQTGEGMSVRFMKQET